MKNKYTLNKFESKILNEINTKYYMPPVLARIKIYVKKYGTVKSLSYLHEIISGCQIDVEVFLDERIKLGEIKDKSQARKSIVGNIFPSCIVYLFLLAKTEGLVNPNIFITTNTKNKIFNQFTTIIVDGETQKPDMDLIIYSVDKNGDLNNLMITSLKTSLRERAGQTYKWKLLMEIAIGCSDIKEKYKITYNPPKMPLVCFATINFYNEINNPQHKGMFKFFDNSFIGKPLGETFIENLEGIVEYSNKYL